MAFPFRPSNLPLDKAFHVDSQDCSQMSVRQTSSKRSKREQIKKSAVYDLENLTRGFADGTFTKNKKKFVVNCHNGRILGFMGDNRIN